MLTDLKDVVDKVKAGERFTYEDEEYIYIQQINVKYNGNIECVLAIKVNDTIPGTVLLVPYNSEE